MGVAPAEERFRRLYEAFHRGEIEIIREAFAQDLVWHVPGRHELSGDHDLAATLALFEQVIPEFSETGEAIAPSFHIDIESIHAIGDWVYVRVHWNHARGDKRFDQHGVEVYRLDPEGKIAEFWAFMSDTSAFDEFFS